MDAGIKVNVGGVQRQVTSIPTEKTSIERIVTDPDSPLDPTSSLLNSSTGDCDLTGSDGDNFESNLSKCCRKHYYRNT